MPDLDDLGSPPIFGDILRAAEAIDRLRLAGDAAVPDSLALAAAALHTSVVTAVDGLAVALELEAEGVRAPVVPVPPPASEAEAAMERPPIPLWMALSDVHARLGTFVATAQATPPPSSRGNPYTVALSSAVEALDAIEAQRQEALRTGGPPHTDPPKRPPARGAQPEVEADAGPEEKPPSLTGPSRDGGDDAARFTQVLIAPPETHPACATGTANLRAAPRAVDRPPTDRTGEEFQPPGEPQSRDLPALVAAPPSSLPPHDHFWDRSAPVVGEAGGEVHDVRAPAENEPCSETSIHIPVEQDVRLQPVTPDVHNRGEPLSEGTGQMPPATSPADVIRRFLQDTEQAERSPHYEPAAHPSSEELEEKQRRYMDEVERRAREQQRDQSQGQGLGY